MKINIKPEHLKLLKEILAKHAPKAEALAYGSRVKGESHDTSDLDIVLRYHDEPNKPQNKFNNIKEILKESNIPILIDLKDWAKIPENFRQEISKNHAIIKPDSDP